MHTHKKPCESIQKLTNMQSLSSIMQVCISNFHSHCKAKPQFTHKTNQLHYLHMYIHKHPCESKPKLTNMQSFSSILQGCIQLKQISSRIHILPKIHKQTW